MALSFGPLGFFVLRRMPRHVLGRLMIGCGLTAAAAVVAVCWSALLFPAWLSQWLWVPPLVVIPFMLLRFPDGELPSPRWRLGERLLAVMAGLAVVSLAVAATQAPQTLLTSIDTPLTGFTQALVRVALAALAGVAIGALAVGVGVASRWRSASALGRRQLACLLPSALLLVVGAVLDFVNVPGGWVPAVVALPLGLTLAILQYRLYDLDLFIHRGVVWLVLTALAVAVYAVAVGLGERWLAGRGSFSTAIVAGGLVAAILLPAERLVQRAVGRLLFGRRDDPYAVLTQVGRHIEGVTDPLAVLPRFAATLVAQLRVPYAALVLHPTSDDTELMVEHGRRVSNPERFAMRAHGVEVGELLVGSSAPGRTLLGHRVPAAPRPRRAGRGRGGSLPQHAGDPAGARAAGVRAGGGTAPAAPRPARRCRLRPGGCADAGHGGPLPSCLRGSGLRPAGPAHRRPGQLHRGGTRARRRVASRRPRPRSGSRPDGPVAGTPTPGPKWSLQLSADLGDLPAAVEVVAYRIVTEAVTNVIKHAGATRGDIDVATRDQELVILVSDDGDGVSSASRPPTDVRHGIGLSSIRSRVDEVGGEFAVISGPAGTQLRATLPARGNIAGNVGPTE